jgi:hypothetical protein
MSSASDALRRKRYAEDPEYRAKKLALNRAYRRKRREEINAQTRERWRSDAEFRARRCACSRECWRRNAYGLTTEDYGRMLARQNGACAICKQVFQETPAVDHCHTTGKVRGLLCRKCNTGLGSYDDEPGRLREAAAYLEASRGVPPEE